ncbi:MAG: hypothetical protein ACK43N_14065, partial [Pirellulaceae bacterium]
MFGRKTSKDVEAAIEAADSGNKAKKKAEKPKKEKAKPKVATVKAGSTRGGAGEFFLRHTEKLVLGLTALTAGYLLYDG